MRLGVIGAGYWGSKIINSASNLATTVIIDIKNGDSWQNSQLDAVIVATPADQHYLITKWYLEQGIHVLCEKPTSMYSVEQQVLNTIAANNNLVYQAGHILLFQPNVEYMLDLVKGRNLRHVESRRLNWGRLQTNLDLASHLAPHDISVIDKLSNDKPIKIVSQSQNFNNGPQKDYANFELTYKHFSATITLGWQWPRKIREFVVTCDDMQIWLDDQNLQIIEGTYISEKQNLTQGTPKVITFNPKETPLEKQIKDFISCIKEGRRPRADTDHMMRVVDTVTEMSRQLYV